MTARLAALTIAWLVLGACRDPMAPRASPDDRLVLTPSLYDGALVRLVVTEASTGRVVDDVRTDESDQMRWVSGWLDRTSYVFWGSDTGQSWVRHLGSGGVTQSPPSASVCRALEALYEDTYHERGSRCLERQ